ncbi:hypothetical protein KY084_13960 [Stakelama sp. CBK3Z-3]|uniref:Uncharacterized protein n=1 Tax=Stakelama flava TaxID=2860338 RepID=A0ABS6XP27_9SPHN|nr:hypothetical protein [Stakelama flava]MBW4331973.1 hypothetical protein [Stakelama flava]
MADWLGRTLLLVLSGLATFAVLLSLQSASQVDTAERSVNPPVSAQNDDAADKGGGAGRASDRETQSSGAPGQPSAAPGPAQIHASDQRAPETAIWLRAITYALLALAGFAAAGLLVLLRITALLARIAGR